MKAGWTMPRRSRIKGFRMSADDVFFWANWMLVAALIGGVLATYAIVVSGNIRDANLRRELNAANERTAQVEASNLALEAKIAPRRLDLDKQKAIISALSPFAGETVIVRSYMLDVESAILGGQLIDILNAAHIVPADRRMSESSSNAIALGIHVVGDNKPLVVAILTALKKVGGFIVSPEPPPPPMISQGGSGVYGSATIFVGVKPLDTAK
jgi:hypothetical protein